VQGSTRSNTGADNELGPAADGAALLRLSVRTGLFAAKDRVGSYQDARACTYHMPERYAFMGFP
jgi:hypothetical protein